MEEKGVSGSFMVISEENSGSLYPMIFSVSCAYLALRLQPEPEICDEKWSEIRSRVLKGSALVGLLVWTVQRNVVSAEKLELLEKVKNAEIEVAELKKRRSEDAKGNEKVVSIFAGREQSWLDERRKLRHQIGGLMNDLRVVEAKKEKSVAELGEKLKEIEVILQLKDKMIEEAERRRLESEVKLKAAEDVGEELRESVKSEAERHWIEITKHKTAFIELEAETGRTLRQVEAAKHEVDAVLEQMVLVNQRLSMEMVRMHRDLEQKEQILSAMLRKSTAEKQMLIKEVKSSKVKRKQAEIETERWKAVCESKHERYSLRNMFLTKVMTPSEYNHSEMKKGVEFLSFVSHPYLPHGAQELTDAKHLRNWDKSEAEIYEQKHHVEIDAFMEQLRQKDEKLEAYNWRLMSTEMESKRLQSHVEALDRDIARLRQDNARLEDILVEREAKMMHFLPPTPQKLNLNGDDTVWSRVKVFKRKARQEMEVIGEGMSECQVVVDTDELQDIVLTLEPANMEIKEGKESDVAKASNCTWKMDVHALGVLYKVKRLRQQLFMLERLTGKKQNSENERVKGLVSLLNKQVDRYDSLQGKIDDLSKRMQENNVSSGCGDSTSARQDDETKMMEQFLEETFQLQRYIVATGQKVMEVQTKIASNLVAEAQGIEKPGGFNIERFGESLKTLFLETQRGLEVRISRIIGDLEGTLARNTWRRL